MLCVVMTVALIAVAAPCTFAADDKPKDTKGAVTPTKVEKAVADKKAADERRAAEDAKRKADDAKKKADQEAKLAEERKKAEEARLAREAKMKAEAEEKARLKAEQDKREAEAIAARAAAKAISDRFDSMSRTKLTRTPEDVFRAIERMSASNDASLSDAERYLLYVQAGEWEKLHALIAPLPGDFAPRLYSKVLSDLMWTNPKAVFLPQDVLRLADAAPIKLDDKNLLALGKLLSYAIAKNDSRAELMKSLQKGTKNLGGVDAAKRQAAARLLGGAEFWVEAKEFGLQESEIPKLVVDVKSQVPLRLAEQNWEPLVKALQASDLVGEAREEVLAALHQTMIQSTPQVIDAKLRVLLQDSDKPQLTREVVTLVGRKTAHGQTDFDFDVRRINLDLQVAVLKSLPTGAIADPAIRSLANLYARNWLAEVQNTLTMFPTWRKSSNESKSKYQHVTIEQMLESAPKGAWLGALELQVAASVQLAAARLILLTENLDRLAPILAAFTKTDKATAALLGNDYLLRWAQLHDPNFTQEALRQYKLEGHAIVLTRAEQEASLRELGGMLGKLDVSTRDLLDVELLVTAFDLCHSRAEVYTRDQFVEVFGPIDQASPTLVLALVERMRRKLGLNWRNLTVQRDAATRRNIDDVFQLVNHGYAEADQVADAWIKSHPDDWRMNCVTGSLLSDWSEFAYFQAVVGNEDEDRFVTYLKRTADALSHFREAAKAYSTKVPKMKQTDFDLLPYRAWFYGLLGIAHEGDVNLRKGVTREGLHEIRDAMAKLPGGAAGVHLRLFSTMVADNVKGNLIAPEMKYRYLSSAVEITGRGDRVYPAEEKVQYYESLLKEIRLESRLDGSAKIRERGSFGVFVSLVHTADLARESGGFGKYLQNETRRTVSGRTITEQPFYRDRFEEALRLALGDFFEIRTILFADVNAGAHDYKPAAGVPAETTATRAESHATQWQETPLAYLHLVAKDTTVDRLPALEIELDFFDRDGKVVIPVPSPPVLIEISPDAPAKRPISEVELTEIIDSRELVEHKRLKMDVVATAHGLIPGLDELIDMKSFGLPVVSVDDREGLLVRELKADDSGMYPMSERSWTVELDPTSLLRGAKERIDFQFPKTLSTETKVVFRTYKDLDPIEAASLVPLVEGEEVKSVAQPDYRVWALGFGAAILALGGLIYWVMRKRPDVIERAPPFVVPRDVTPFSVVSLLHRIRTSPDAQLTEEARVELYREIVTLERAAFATKTTPQSTPDLELLAARWVRSATPN